MAYKNPDEHREKIRRWSREHYHRNKERICAERRAAWADGRLLASKIKSAYGITLEEYRKRLAQPCAICGAPSTDLDHCHETGTARLGLCGHCNKGLGFFRENPDSLRAAAAYLEGF